MNHDNGIEPSDIVTLGQLIFRVNLDTSEFSIQVENQQTGQLTSPTEVANLMPMTGIQLFCQEIQRRSRSTIIT